MEADSEQKKRPPSVLSWAALILALACLGLFAWYVPDDFRRHALVYKDFKMPLPRPVNWMSYAPAWNFQVVAGVLAIWAIAVQLRSTDRRNAALFHMLIVLGCCVVFIAYRESIMDPMFRMYLDVDVATKTFN